MNTQRRIAFVLGGLSFGGAERVITILANHYAQKGWQVDILTLLKPDCDFVLHPSTRHIHLGGKAHSRALRAPAWLFGLRHYMQTEKPEIVVSFAARINLLTLGAAVGVRRPRIVISERNDPLHDTRTAMVVKLTRLLYPSADAIVFQTQHAKSCFPENIQKKGCIIPNPLQGGLPSAASTGTRVVSVGKLMQQKNHALLIKAFAKLASRYPEHTLHIYGDGPLRKELQTLIEENSLQSRVILEGWKSDVPAETANACLFVLTSNYEGLSNALMEALAMGLPCISTNCAGAEDLIENGVSGLVIPIGDDEQLCRAMERMLSDTQFASACGANAREAMKKFAPKTIICRWESIIESSIESEEEASK